ncbi:hypothetical protein F1188_13045 [Roseospira marina]|uniref:Uncharacterized protein n=1 Tax=Roseospira marina TaxID=140057 RepID=A0A5M6I9K7_9PROT|nr:hypothetical protein [Roseospira marina]KAA5604964.1 hypothetical protein F1188_13045 [Roseospira marina]MBB4315035.1 hypothetical protein [Roseospira marina]MBB5088035.1 hypothetical protein [Roseospira marina]
MAHDRTADAPSSPDPASPDPTSPDWVMDAVLRREAAPVPWQDALIKGDLAETWLGSVRIVVEVLAGPSEAPDLPGGWRVVRAFSTYYPEGEVGTAAVSDLTQPLGRDAFDAAVGALRGGRA